MSDSHSYWSAIYYNSSNRDKANDIIRRLAEDGVFLVRDGTQGDKVLVVYADNKPRKFRIENVRPTGRYMTIPEPLSELPVPSTSIPNPAPLSDPVLRDAPHFVDIDLDDDDTPTQSPVRVFLSRVSGFLRRVFRGKMDA